MPISEFDLAEPERSRMQVRYPTPEALVAALQRREDAARAQFQEWLQEPIRRLMDGMRQRLGLTHRQERLTEHALHAAETFVRTRPLREFAGLTRNAFQGAVLLHVGRQVAQPYGRMPGELAGPEPLPPSRAYDCQTVFMPSEKIGSFWFGGDWYGGHETDDGTLWLIVADITGHGYYAYILAQALPAVWRTCWAAGQLPADPQPTDLLTALHSLLADCLPDGVFVECTLARLTPDGRVTAAPAGGARMLVRDERRNRVDMVKMRGVWLGLERPLTDEHHTCILAENDELLIATDGIFDQLYDYLGPKQPLAATLSATMKNGGLLETLSLVLQKALAAQPQKDDITAVVIRRKLR